MAKSVRQAWNYRKNATPDGEDKELRKVAEDKIRERNETDHQDNRRDYRLDHSKAGL